MISSVHCSFSSLSPPVLKYKHQRIAASQVHFSTQQFACTQADLSPPKPNSSQSTSRDPPGQTAHLPGVAPEQLEDAPHREVEAQVLHVLKLHHLPVALDVQLAIHDLEAEVGQRPAEQAKVGRKAPKSPKFANDVLMV